MTLRRGWAWLGFGLGALVLVLRLWRTVDQRLVDGDSIYGALYFFFTFLTILTNLQLVLTYLSDVSTARWLSWWRSPVTRAMTAGLITLVGVYYHFFLLPLGAPTGLDGVLNIYLHYLAPLLFVGWWFVTQPHGSLRFADIPMMLIPGLIYLALVFTRGLIVDEYPYPVLDVGELGYPQVALNMVLMAAVTVAIFALYVGFDRLLGRRASIKSA